MEGRTIRKFALALAGFILLMGIVWLQWRRVTIPSYADVVGAQRGSEFLIYDRTGREISRLRQDPRVRHLPWVELWAVSPAFVQKLVEAEDRHFYSHHGVDVRAFFSSVRGRLRGHPLRGASTLTMQVARMVGASERSHTLREKLAQTLAALKLEHTWSKEQILEVYLNLVDFRGEYRGLRSASQAFFGKNPAGLDRIESSILVAMIRAPNADFAKITQRACRLSLDDCDQIMAVVQTIRENPARIASANQAPHFSRWLWAQANPQVKSSGRAVSTIDGELQEFASEALRTQISSLRDQNVHDGAILVLDNRTGEVLAYVGSSGDLSASSQIDGVQARRQVGSTLKPFLYGTAFEKKILAPDSWLEDSPVEIVFPNGVYRPQNHDKSFHGWVRARSALASSLNVPAVKVFKMLGDDSFWRTLSRLHLGNLKDADLYGAALALGVADLNLWDLTNAYRALANDGVWTPVRWTASAPMIAPTERIFSVETARSLRQILSSAQDRQMGFGYETSLATRFPAAVKTGTSKDMRDNWCFGFSQDYTVGVWVGNFDGQPMWNVLGVTGAAPLWNKVLTWLHENRRSQATSIAGAVPPPIDATPTNYPVTKIAYPSSGLSIAIDPGIPRVNQKIPLVAEGQVTAQAYWELDGKYWRPARQTQTWPLEKGLHRFSLKVGTAVLDSTEILVR